MSPGTASESPQAGHVLVTGCTGFIGKVVLAELVRRQAEFGLGRIDVLIRPKRGQDPATRFAAISESPCFSQLPAGWQAICHPVVGDITEPDLGLSPADAERITASLTQLIHCAASVEFDLPLAEAASYNMTGALHALAVAKRSPRLKAFVDVSTAYVWPHTGGDAAFAETLVPVALDATATYEAILAGQADEKALLAATGHPNTYTFTKCFAERLLAERQDGVPIAILRPSIVSACWERPTPGWIDSKAAFAGFVALFGLGHLRALGADPNSQLDLVPCDLVVDRILRCAFDPGVADRTTPAIRYAVAGTTHSAPVGQIAAWGTDYFTRFPAGARPVGFRHLGERNWRFHWFEGTSHRLPPALARVAATLTGNARLARQAARLGEVLVYLNRGFAHFMSRTYDFRPSWPLQERGFTAERYLRTIFRGVSRHLLDADAAALAIGGREAKMPGTDGLWALRGPGNGTIRLFGYGLRKVLRRACSALSVDLASFEAALAQLEPGTRIVVVPSHRSYLDFLVLPYLFFSKPDLGIGMPHIAATDAFARIPVVGRLLKQAQAFYIRRGVGSADPTVSRQVDALLGSGRVLKFFIEGTRSRSRRFLPARRGLLRAIQGTGHPVALLPVAVSYDRVPEERAILAELRGDGKPQEGLGALLRWLGAVARGRIQLGRVHVACGQPLILAAASDVPHLASQVISELQRRTVVSTYHLDVFTASQAELGWPTARLQAALQGRGAQVLSGLPLAAGAAVDPLLVRSLEQQWLPWFFPDLLAWLPDHPAVRHQVKTYGHGMAECAASLPDRDTQQLLTALFAPICRDYATVARYLAERAGESGGWRLETLYSALPQVFRPDIEAVLDDLAARQILAARSGEYGWGPEAVQIHAYAAGSAWPADVLVNR